jgi:3-hydroxymyristoyl/3-hydroxydecanoyl-(acyl carrier protein) dehydratase
MNEPFFVGHFPGRPIMPGVLIIEALAQTACVLMLRRPDLKGKLAFFMGIEEAKFRKPVVPGDLLELRIEVLRAGGRVGKVRGEAFVGGEMTTEANFTFIITERPD